MSWIVEQASTASPWLHSGSDPAGVTVCSRVRLARAVAGRPFQRKLSPSRQQELVQDVLSACAAGISAPSVGIDLSTLSTVERLALVERRLASRELVSGKHPAGVFVADDESLAIMANEEDHVRLQAFAPGLDVDTALAGVVAADRSLERLLPWVFHDRFGYLTACHTNAGTGMRVSVMLHLPALDETGEIKPILKACEKLHLAVRGAHGEGSDPGGHLYQISNLRSLGVDEPTLVRQVRAAATRIRDAELTARESLVVRSKGLVEDRGWRAWGLLAHARSLTYDELAEHLGWLRLALALGVLNAPATGSDRPGLASLLLLGQPGHLQLAHTAAADPAVRDQLRATLVRSRLSSDP